ncbi:hypothetical protein ACOSP7_030937 [Xanthoceras sorbifolium]
MLLEDNCNILRMTFLFIQIFRICLHFFIYNIYPRTNPNINPFAYPNTTTFQSSANALVMPNIRAIELEDFITGNRPCPSKFVETLASNGVDKELTLNPEFSVWKKYDQFLLGWLLSTISEGLIGFVTECLTSLEAWKTLESMFSQQSMAKVLQLKQ